MRSGIHDFTAEASSELRLSIVTTAHSDDMRPLYQDWKITAHLKSSTDNERPLGRAYCRPLSLRSMSADPQGLARLLDEPYELRSGQVLGFHIAENVLERADRDRNRYLLILDDLVVEPEHRGQRLSLPIARLVMSYFGTTHDLVIWDASPHYRPPTETPAEDPGDENLRWRLALHSARTGADEYGDRYIFTRALGDLAPMPFE